ncbi:MAG TPA: hypothetical protein VNH38_04415 [Candidatus Dormibacteraeota bacterium]|nr:hypothetical protein [Candidatus Dormibacteraeota bacterium]
MSREMGWKQFQLDEPDPARSEQDAQTPAPAPLAPTPFGGSPGTDTPALGGSGPLAWETGSRSADADAPELASGRPVQPAPAAAGPARSLRLGELVWLCLAVVDACLALDFLLRAIAARDSGLGGVVIRVGNSLASPFVGVFNRQGVPTVDHTNYWAALVAIVIYTVAAGIALRLLRVLAAPAGPGEPKS